MPKRVIPNKLGFIGQEEGSIPLLFLVAIFGVISFLVISQTFFFKNSNFASFFANKQIFAATTQTLASDIDLSGKIDIFDFNRLLADFGKLNTASKITTVTSKVDIFDFNQLMADFGKTGAVMAIYKDGFTTASWVNWSWGGTANFANTTRPFWGSKHVSFKPTAQYAGLFLHSNTPISTSGFDTITLAIQSDLANTPLTINAYDATGAEIAGSKVPLNNYGGSPSVGSYKIYKIPLADLKSSNTQISGFTLQDVSSAIPTYTIYVDRIALTNQGLVSPTPTPTTAPPPPPPPPTPTPTPVTGAFNTSVNCYGLSIPSYTEVRPVDNAPTNYAGPTPVKAADLNPNDSATIKSYYLAVDGFCRGTTEQILEWAARKWGFGSEPGIMHGKVVDGKVISQPALNLYADLAKADAVAESRWYQTSVNWNTCGAGSGPDGYNHSNPACATYGINQSSCAHWPSCYPLAKDNTAYSPDMAMAVIRGHYDGIFVGWTDNGAKGNIRNAIGAWECGCAVSTNNYAETVLGYLNNKPWKNLTGPDYRFPF